MSNQIKASPFLAAVIVLVLASCSPVISSTNRAPASSAEPMIFEVSSSSSNNLPAIQATPAAGSPSSGPLAAFQDTLEQIYEKVNPSVVNVSVVIANTGQSGRRGQFGFGSQMPQTGLGSGFVWDTQGHIVTNNHVIDGATKITVTFADGVAASAKVIGADPNSDLAVLQVDVPANELNPVEIADSTLAKVGQMVIAIGNPYGLSGTMTSGIISGLDRTLPVDSNNSNSLQSGTYSIPDIIQTDASINPGNSGGVLVDVQGRLLGVTAAIASTTQSNSGIGFVIPSVIVQKVVPALIQNGRTDHAWMGVTMTSLTSDLASANSLKDGQRGVLVINITPNSPAQKAGLQASTIRNSGDGQQIPTGGDVITAVDHQPVNRYEDLVSYLYENTQPGQKITLTLLRNGQQKEVDLTLGTLPSEN